ncbi:hypothetical protein [Lacrimispora sp.]
MNAANQPFFEKNIWNFLDKTCENVYTLKCNTYVTFEINAYGFDRET